MAKDCILCPFSEMKLGDNGRILCHHPKLTYTMVVSPQGKCPKEKYIDGLTFDEETALAHLKFIGKLYLRLAVPKMWGLHPEYGYTRPQVIDYNGEWYIKMGEDNTYFKEPECDWKAAIASGLYQPTGVKVGDEEKELDDETKAKLTIAHPGIKFSN